MTLFIATSNPGKLRDFLSAAATASGFKIEPLPGLADIEPPPEDEVTFEGNARVKAAYYSRFLPGRWVLADDSGLEVDALGGLPGVRSARFAADRGMTASEGVDVDNNRALLAALHGVADRTARYRCVLAAAMDGRVEATASGTLEGHVLHEPAGTGGFGYDPLFFAPELGMTTAQAEMQDRLRVSHRGRALRALLRQWKPC